MAWVKAKKKETRPVDPLSGLAWDATQSKVCYCCSPTTKIDHCFCSFCSDCGACMKHTSEAVKVETPQPGGGVLVETTRVHVCA